MKRQWFKDGFWNTLEHGVTRLSDALTSLILLWVLPAETFSRLALAQAAVAPLLFLFLSPEVVLYRDYSKWRELGSLVSGARLRAFRRFAWLKAFVALLLCLTLAFLWNEVAATAENSENTGGIIQVFWSLVWAFALALAPQIAGPDREFLRLDLKLKELNGVTLYQKLTLLGGTLAVAVVHQVFFREEPAARFWVVVALAFVATFSSASTALLARWRAVMALREWSSRESGGTSPAFVREGFGASARIILEALRSFSLWSHVQGVVTNWVQTMDVFFLGMFSLPARETGLYAAVLKLANFTAALPVALANLFSIWIGRGSAGNPQGEARELARLSGWFFLGVAVQAVVFVLIAPWLIHLLSHGRWSAEEQQRMYTWLLWIVSGTALVSSSYLCSSWLVLRGLIMRFLLQVILPWGGLSLLIYGVAVRYWGFDGAARANVAVAACYLVLLTVLGFSGPVRALMHGRSK